MTASTTGLASSPLAGLVDEAVAPTIAAGRPDTMRAIVYHEYGSADVLTLQEIEKPVATGDEVLVRVRAASANPGDVYFMRGLPYIFRFVSGLGKPKNNFPGHDLAGEVEAIGKDVTRFNPGDEVFANVETGGFAEYPAVSENALALKPANPDVRAGGGGTGGGVDGAARSP